MNANVQIKIFTEKIRNHPLAPRVSRALSSVPQWRDFFGPAALDPINDIDRMLIAGPQLRDSSEVAVVVKVNVPQARVREALDGIVRSDPQSGAWLDREVPVAKARVDRAERFFIIPAKSIVVVAPPTAVDNVIKNRKKLTLKGSAGSEVVTAKLVTPWRPFRHTGIDIDIPKSIEYALFKVTPDEHGGTTVEIEHATASELVDWEGQQLDPLPSVGAGWETVMAYALPAYLRGELPDKPASEWFEFTPEVMDIANRIYEEWMAMLATPAQ